MTHLPARPEDTVQGSDRPRLPARLRGRRPLTVPPSRR
jgi:hypothetical protein